MWSNCDLGLVFLGFVISFYLVFVYLVNFCGDICLEFMVNLKVGWLVLDN